MNKINIVDHGNHEHKYRAVNETIMGLVLVDNDGMKNIAEVFGWTDDDFVAVGDAMLKFRNFQHAAEALQEDLPRSTRISLLADFLKSHYFKKIGKKIESPNDYFILGAMWGLTIYEDRVGNRPMPMGHVVGGDIIEMIKKMTGGQ